MRRPGIADFLGDTGKSVLVLATVVGAYFGAVSIHAERAFALLLGLSLLYAVMRRSLPGIRTRWKAYRQLLRNGRAHNQVLTALAQRQVEVEGLSNRLVRAEAKADEQFDLGVLEGRRRVVGEILATGAPNLVPQAIAIDADGALVVWAETIGPTPELEGHWQLRVRGLGAIKAVFRVSQVTASGVALALDRVSDVAFMESLRESAGTSSDFPGSLELIARTLDGPTDLLKEE